MTIRRLTTGTIAWALALVVGACGGGESIGGPGGPAVVQSVDVTRNDSLTVRVQGTSDTVVAVLRDANGDPVAGDLAAWEVNGGSDAECGFWEASSLQSNVSGEVKNILNGGEMAWTNSATPECIYRVVHSSEGAPEPVVDSVHVTMNPAPARILVASKVMEDGTFDQFGPDGGAVVQLTKIWEDGFDNPSLYDAAVTSGPAHVVTLSGAPEWTRSVEVDGPEGTGTLEIWSLPDSSLTLSGTFEVTHFDGGAETWICVVLEDGTGVQTACEGPPSS